MAEYVYALHDFQPENEDEVPFQTGERIEVVEKDDEFGDGWWQGRNLSGKVGLFPVAYTTPVPPTSQSVPNGLSSYQTSRANDDHEEPRQNGHHVEELNHDDHREEPYRTSYESDYQSPLALESIHEHEEPAAPAYAPAPAPVPAPPVIHAPEPVRLHSDQSLYPESPIDGREPSPHTHSEDGRRMMSATLTDVQQAIEQLGARRGADDGGRSFSFVSSRSGVSASDTEGEPDEDEYDTEYGDDDDQGWHKDARTKLAEKARRAAEREQRAREREEARATLGPRTIAPPIEVELSDESEPEEDDTRHPAGPPGSGIEAGSSFIRSRLHSDIPEESESGHASTASGGARSRVETPEPTATATRSTFNIPPLPLAVGATIYHPPDDPRARRASSIYPAFEEQDIPPEEQEDHEESFILPTPISPAMSLPTPAEPKSIPMPTPVPANPVPTVFTPAPVVQAPIVNQEALQHPTTLTPARPIVQARDIASSPVSPTFQTTFTSPKSSVPTPIPLVAPVTPPPPNSPPQARTSKTHPSEWTVDEVVDWLRSKGFDQQVLDAFVEQEITGDVLLDIDASVLKSEFGIVAFGKRTRIANAISELKRPASFSSADLRPFPGFAPIVVPAPGAGVGGSLQTPSGSGGHSLRSESPLRTAETGVPLSAGSGSLNHRRNISDVSGSVASSVRWVSAAETTVDGSEGASFASIAPGKGNGMQSPSDGALRTRAVHQAQIPEEAEEERVAMSEGETAPKEKSKRRQFFGRSLDSNVEKEVAASPASAKSAKSEGAKSASAAGTATETGSVRSRHSKKKSIDQVDKKTDRLSIFGGIGGSIKSAGRKPAPRYSVVVDTADVPTPEKQHSSRLLSSLYPHSSGKRSSSGQEQVSPVEGPKDSAASQRGQNPSLLRKRTVSQNEVPRASAPPGPLPAEAGVGAALKQGQSILEQIGTPDHEGWMRKKGERYNSWKVRYFVLKGPHLYCMRSNSRAETKIKGYIHITGYKVVADENIDAGRYGFRLVHEGDKVHFFSSEEKSIIREWMKALIKATITRDYQKPVISSVNIPTIPLQVAQTMNPAPRPPSPSARDATQRATRRDNPNQLSTRDAQILMGIPGQDSGALPAAGERRLPSAFRHDAPALSPSQSMPSPLSPRMAPGGVSAPPRPSREMRRGNSMRDSPQSSNLLDPGLVEWANVRLPPQLQIRDTSGSLCSGLTLLRLAEAIKGKPASPPVPDRAFPSGPDDDKLDGLFCLFDFLLDNDVKVGSVSIQDIRQGRRDKIIQILRALRQWEDKRRSVASSLGRLPAVQGGIAMPPGAAWGATGR